MHYLTEVTSPHEVQSLVDITIKNASFSEKPNSRSKSFTSSIQPTGNKSKKYESRTIKLTSPTLQTSKNDNKSEPRTIKRKEGEIWSPYLPRLYSGSMSEIIPDCSSLYNSKDEQLMKRKSERLRNGSSKLSRHSLTQHVKEWRSTVEPKPLWFLLFCVAIPINLLMGMDLVSFSIYYVEYSEHFPNNSQSSIAIIVALQSAVMCFFDIVSSVLITRYGCKATCVAGGVIYFASQLLSSFAPSILMLYFTQGVMFGIGASCCYLTTNFIIQKEFKRNKALAGGLCYVGFPIGIFLGASILTYLIREYGWRGALLIQSAIGANMIALGTMLDLHKIHMRLARNNHTTRGKAAETRIKHSNDKHLIEDGEACRNKSSDHHSVQKECEESYTKEYNEKQLMNETNSEQHIEPTSNNQLMKSEGHEICMTQSNGSQLITKTGTEAQVTRCNDQQIQSTENSDMVIEQHLQQIQSTENSDMVMEKQPIQMESTHNGDMVTTQVMENLLMQTECEVADIEKTCCTKCERGHQIIRFMKDVFDFGLFKHVPFTILCVGCMFGRMLMGIYFQHMPSRLAFLGMTKEQCAQIVSAFSICIVISRICVSFLANIKNGNRAIFYSCGGFVGALASFVLVVFKSYTGQMIGGVMQGLASGLANTVTYVMLVDFMGMDTLVRAMALYNLLFGIAGFLTAPIGGLLYDLTQDYDPPFLFSGVAGLLTGTLILIAAVLDAASKRKALKKANIPKL